MTPQILNAKVMHRRLFPKANEFIYGMYYLALPLSRLSTLADGWRMGVDAPGIVSFHTKDHGGRDGGDLRIWIDNILKKLNINGVEGEVILVCLPRILGYVFNPVSFWLCHDKAGNLRAVLCEVNNTFGENHNYVCVPENGEIIGPGIKMETMKVFHVSPFMPRDGHYDFRFSVTDKGLGVWIDYYDKNGNKQLLTSVTGTFQPMNRQSLRNAFWAHPLVTFKTIGLIHWQAVKLWVKGVKYVPKPAQLDTRLTRTKK